MLSKNLPGCLFITSLVMTGVTSAQIGDPQSTSSQQAQPAPSQTELEMETQGSPGVNAMENATETAMAERPVIIVDGAGRLTVKVKDQPLKAVLADVARNTGVRIQVSKEVEGQLIKAEFATLPLVEGLQRLLGNSDYFLLYSGGDGTTASLKSVWVYAKGNGAGLAPQDGAGAHSIAERVSDLNPEIRAQALEKIMERGDEGAAKKAISQGLEDTDDNVRYRALSAALARGIPLPKDTLPTLLRNDGSEQVRLLALRILPQAPDTTPESIKSMAELALSDSSPAVQDEARKILDGQIDALRASPATPGADDEQQRSMP